MFHVLHSQKTAFACVIEILIGILLLINPVGLTNIICTLIGLFLVLRGVSYAVGYFRAPATAALMDMNLGEGLILCLTGLFLIFGNGWLLSMGLLSVLTLFYGVLLLFLALEKVQWAVDRFRMGVGRWYIAAIDAAITAILGIVIVSNPWMSAEVLWVFIAVSMIVSAVMDLALIFVFRAAME